MLRLEGEFCGAKVKLWRPKRQRHLEWLGGTASTACPVTLYFRGAERLAKKEASRLKRYGYKVKMKREKAAKERAS